MSDVKRQWKRIRQSAAIDLWTTANPTRAGELRAKARVETTDDSGVDDTLPTLILQEIATQLLSVAANTATVA
jgi:hypothetical protein